MDIIGKQEKESWSRFIEWSSLAAQWHGQAAEDMELVTPGRMWRPEEVEELRARGQAPIEIPIILPQIDLQKSIILGRNPSFKCVPITDSDTKKASLLNIILNYYWNLAGADAATEQVVSWQLVCGKGYYYLIWDETQDKFIIKAVSPLNVFPDPSSSDPFEEDSSYKYFARNVSADFIKSKWPELSEIVDSVPTSQMKFFIGSNYSSYSIPAMDEIASAKDKKILMLEEQRKTAVPMIRFTVTYKTDEGTVTTTKELEKDIFFSTIVGRVPADMLKSVIEFNQERVVRRVLLHDILISEQMLPVSKYTITPVPFKFFGNPYTVGLVRLMKGLQEETNHRRSLAIAYSAAALSGKIILPKGAVQDKDKFERDLARPGGVPEADFSFGAPLVLPNANIPAQLMNLELQAKNDAQFIAGTYAISHGSPQDVPTTVGATQLLDEFSTRRLSVTSRYLYWAIQTVGENMLAWLQSGAAAKDKILRIYAPEGESEKEIISVGVGDVYSEKDLDAILDPTVGKYDVRVVVGSMSESLRVQELKTTLELYRLGLVDDMEVMKKLDIPNKAELVKRKALIFQLQAALKEKETQLEELKSENLRMGREVYALRNSLNKLKAMKGIDTETEIPETEQAEPENRQMKIPAFEPEKAPAEKQNITFSPEDFI